MSRDPYYFGSTVGYPSDSLASVQIATCFTCFCVLKIALFDSVQMKSGVYLGHCE